jgi:hypothetical protein
LGYFDRITIMQKEVIEKIAALITAAFGLIAALHGMRQFKKSSD